MKKLFVFKLFVFFAIFASHAGAETIKFSFSLGKPVPYVIDENRGIEVEIVKNAFKSVGIEVIPVWLTYNRMALIKEMDFDGRGVTKPREGDGLFYSEPYIFYQDVALTKSAGNIRLGSIKDMANFKVGAWQTAARDIGGEFYKLFGKEGKYRKNFHPVFDDYRRIKMLWTNRLDIVVMDLLIFDHFTQKLSEEFGRKLSYDVHWLWGKKHWFHTAFKKENHRNLFNKGLDQIKSEGTFEKIYKKYSPSEN